jgi:hypothetical protein
MKCFSRFCLCCFFNFMTLDHPPQINSHAMQSTK